MFLRGCSDHKDQMFFFPFLCSDATLQKILSDTIKEYFKGLILP